MTWVMMSPNELEYGRYGKWHSVHLSVNEMPFVLTRKKPAIYARWQKPLCKTMLVAGMCISS